MEQVLMFIHSSCERSKSHIWRLHFHFTSKFKWEIYVKRFAATTKSVDKLRERAIKSRKLVEISLADILRFVAAKRKKNQIKLWRSTNVTCSSSGIKWVCVWEKIYFMNCIMVSLLFILFFYWNILKALIKSWRFF